jgi:hypothetical protein
VDYIRKKIVSIDLNPNLALPKREEPRSKRNNPHLQPVTNSNSIEEYLKLQVLTICAIING